MDFTKLKEGMSIKYVGDTFWIMEEAIRLSVWSQPISIRANAPKMIKGN